MSVPEAKDPTPPKPPPGIAVILLLASEENAVQDSVLLAQRTGGPENGLRAFIRPSSSPHHDDNPVHPTLERALSLISQSHPEQPSKQQSGLSRERASRRSKVDSNSFASKVLDSLLDVLPVGTPSASEHTSKSDPAIGLEREGAPARTCSSSLDAVGQLLKKNRL
jgi:hypothetical protein